jgi:hypothetical protein
MKFIGKHLGSAASLLLATAAFSANAADLPAKAYVAAPVEKAGIIGLLMSIIVWIGSYTAYL